MSATMATRSYPTLLQVDTRVLLRELSRGWERDPCAGFDSRMLDDAELARFLW